MKQDYVGASSQIRTSDLPALVAGAQLFGPAAGVGGQSMLISWITEMLGDRGPVLLVRPESLPSSAACVSLCVAGSAVAMADIPPTGAEFASAIKALENRSGRPMDAVFPLVAAGTVSALAPIAAAAQLRIPLLDVDAMGRVFALFHQTSLALAGLSPSPLAVSGPTGETVVIDAPSAARAEVLLRSAVDLVGGWAAAASYPCTAGELRSCAIPGTVSRLINVGRVLLDSIDADRIIGRLNALTGCRSLGRGRIVEVEHMSRQLDVTAPAHPSSIIIDELTDDGPPGRLFRLELHSEIVAVFADGDLVAAAPDVICLLDADRGRLATLDNAQLGDDVDILMMPAEAIWYSAAGLDLVGPKTFGIPLPHPRARRSGPAVRGR